MRFFFYALLAVTSFILLISSCGKANDLGIVNGVPVTAGEFLDVFNNLSADLQVATMQPGGKLELMNRIMMKKVLLTAWDDDRSVSAGWEDLYRVSMLSDSMITRIALSFDQEAYVDSISACGYSDYRLSVVLMDDSSAALQTAENWNNDIFDPSIHSIPSPWSKVDGSSYRHLNGPIHKIPISFLPLLTMETGVAQVLPMFGEWCVCILNFEEGEWVYGDEVYTVGVKNAFELATSEVVLAKGISVLAENCTLSGSHIVPSGAGTDEPVVFLSDDTLTVADCLEVMRKVDPVNFPGDVSEEIIFFMSPDIMFTKEVSLWFYVKKIALRYSLAELAVDHGVVLPETALDFARAESVMRSQVLKNCIPDSSEVAAWYEANRDLFLIPERRSVYIAYTESGSPLEALQFDDLGDFRTIADSTGLMVPTSLQHEQAFGGTLGIAIFAADPRVFTGPISQEGELNAWFEVVEVASPGFSSLEEVYSQTEMMAAFSIFSSQFDIMMDDLYVTYSVTIDTDAVAAIDLWSATQ